MASLYLSKLTPDQRRALIQKLHEAQAGNCFICERPIDLKLHADALDIDHVEPLKLGGKDAAENFAITHASCNRSKQASDLRVARVLARFEAIRAACGEEDRGPNLADVLKKYNGAKYPLSFETTGTEMRMSFGATGDPDITSLPLYTDPLSKLRYFFAELPIEYLHHDDRINPRNIGGSLGGLVEEFFRGRPQLHAALAWVDRSQGPAYVKVFDGQHKATAQPEFRSWWAYGRALSGHWPLWGLGFRGL